VTIPGCATSRSRTGRAAGSGAKLWPTLIFIKNGQEIARVVRPDASEEIRAVLAVAT
jgi:hypothetical protein